MTKRTDTLFPLTTLFLSRLGEAVGLARILEGVARALGIGDGLPLRRARLHPFEQGYGTRLAVARGRPAADHVGLAVAERADHRDRLRRRGEGEGAVVLEQHHRPAREIGRAHV